MADAKAKKGLISHGIAAQNRKARYDYTIKDTVEAGLVLKGPEVKSLRHGRATLTEAWAGEREGEMYLFNAYIPEYQGGVLSRFEPRAPRKLLLKRKQIATAGRRGGARGRDAGAAADPLQRSRPRQGAAGSRRGSQESRQAGGDRGARLAARQGAVDAGAGVAGGAGRVGAWWAALRQRWWVSAGVRQSPPPLEGGGWGGVERHRQCETHPSPIPLPQGEGETVSR